MTARYLCRNGRQARQPRACLMATSWSDVTRPRVRPIRSCPREKRACTFTLGVIRFIQLTPSLRCLLDGHQDIAVVRRHDRERQTMLQFDLGIEHIDRLAGTNAQLLQYLFGGLFALRIDASPDQREFGRRQKVANYISAIGLSPDVLHAKIADVCMEQTVASRRSEL